jgi:C4-dicarboxylate-specific signal transduction histidine kinase
VMNALQAVSIGGEVKLSAFTHGERVSVLVEDNGSGIASEMAESVFRPFASTKKDGFGLGLYSCKTIADDHGARLSFTPVPAPGKGTRFTVEFNP